jgi:hypothetical protein
MKATPPKNIRITQATISQTHHGVPGAAAAGTTAIGDAGEPPVVAPGIFDPPEMSWIMFPGSFLYENLEVPEESVYMTALVDPAICHTPTDGKLLPVATMVAPIQPELAKSGVCAKFKLVMPFTVEFPELIEV